MNTDRLSDRLETVAKYVPKDARLADIGSDHAYLPCYLAKKEVITFGVAGEVVEGPYLSAEKNVRSEGLSDIISVRLGDGLSVINPGEVNCVTIAGMGGALISTILENGKDKLNSVKRLILQPNLSSISIRQWFRDNNWELIAEEILEEDGKIYEVLVGEKGNPEKPYHSNVAAELLMGPFLIQSQSPVFKKKWLAEKQNWVRIMSNLEGAAQTTDTEDKKKELQDKIRLVEEVLVSEES